MSKAIFHVAFACFFLFFTHRVILADFDYCWFCIANGGAPDNYIQAKLDAICQRKPELCAPAQPGQPCYVPGDLKGTASYVFDRWYVDQGDCHLEGAGLKYHSDPSHGNCKFPCRWENDSMIYHR